MPLGYTLSPLKLKRGESNGHSLPGSSFNCWKADMYIMSTELPLSMRILLVLKPSTVSIITKGSLWGCFTPLTSSSEKVMSRSVHLCLNGGILWTLFTCLWHAFLRDPNDPPMDGPPMIVFISPITLGRRRDVWSSSLGEGSRWFLLSSLNLLDSPFFTYFYSFPFCMSSSIYSFRSLQSFVLWSWSLWNRQHFFLSHTWGDECSGLGHLR